MAKEKEVTSVNMDNLLPQDMNRADIHAAVFSHLKNAENNALEVTSNYLKPSELPLGVKVPFVFMGMTTMQTDKGEIPAVQLISAKQERLITGGAVIVSSLHKLTKIPCGIYLMNTGETAKSKSGEYDVVRVFIP